MSGGDDAKDGDSPGKGGGVSFPPGTEGTGSIPPEEDTGPAYEERHSRFYLIPPIVLSRMFDDFSPLIGEKRTGMILYQAGYRCGSKMAEGVDIDTGEKDRMESALQELLIQLGLGVLRLREYTPNRVVITCGDSNEARAMGRRSRNSCNFTIGYIRGLLEIIMGVKFISTEKECISTGADMCIYVFEWPDDE